MPGIDSWTLAVKDMSKTVARGVGGEYVVGHYSVPFGSQHMSPEHEICRPPFFLSHITPPISPYAQSLSVTNLENTCLLRA